MVAEAGGAALAKLAGRAGEDVEAAATKEASHEASTFCPLSFAPSTLVSTPKGKQSIASLKVGDKVVAYDPKTGKATVILRAILHHEIAAKLHQGTSRPNCTTRELSRPGFA